LKEKIHLKSQETQPDESVETSSMNTDITESESEFEEGDNDNAAKD